MHKRVSGIPCSLQKERLLQLTDRIYGHFEIDEPVLHDLYFSPALQRLDGVLQHGITGLIGITSETSRLEHSAGVMLLVRMFGGSIVEQCAALLHDVSHTAFSHVIDYVVEDYDGQSYHEEVKADYVQRTGIPALLAAYGYDWRDIIHEERFAILEQPAPALCADRLDYFLRDSLDLALATGEDCQHALRHLQLHHGRLVTNDLDVARWLAYRYIEADERSWADYREVGLYELAARAIRQGIELGVITEDDYWSTDRVVWDRLHGSSDPGLRAALALVSPATQFVWDDQVPDFTISTKIRTIDPDVKIKDTVQPLSALDSEFARYRADYVQRKSGMWPFRVVPPA